ncbi:MAG TPA: phage major capsid protein [Syntrophales bacterium]|nr:phage major capsid protein [Syntrophales bacterium]
MNKFSESQRLLAEKHLRLTLPADPEDKVAVLSWKDLHAERSAVRKAAQAVLDRAKADGRDLTEPETLAFDVGMAYLDAIGEEFDRRDVAGTKEPPAGDQPHRVNFPARGAAMTDFNIFKPKRTWREVFRREPAQDSNIRNIGELTVALYHDDQEKLRQLRTMNAIHGTEGGFAVPEILWSEIYDAGLEQSVTLGRVQIFPMESDTLHIAGWDSDDHTGGPIASVRGSWIGEGAAASAVTPKLRSLSLFAKKLALYVSISSECLQDATALSVSLGTMMRNSLAFSLDQAILTGSGVGQPLGILDAPATIVESRTTANTITFADLTHMMGRMIPSSLDKCVWIASPSTFEILLAMVVAAGSGELVLGYQPGASDIKMAILGRPLVVSEKLPTMAAKGGLILTDLSYYGLGMRETGRFEKTASATWSSDVVDMRLIVRCDGKPLLSAPITPAGGGDTLSPFVVLDA